MKAICSYCGKTIKEGDGKSKEVTHGACIPCFRIQAKELDMSSQKIEATIKDMLKSWDK